MSGNAGRAARKHAPGRAIGIAAAAVVLIAALGLTACSAGSSGTDSSNVSTQDKTNAKQVIMAAGDMFTMVDLGVTDEDSPVTISQSDPAYTEFFDKVLAYKKVADLDVSDVTITATIKAVTANTAREDSTQVNYRFTITDADMVVNGVHVTYNSNTGFTAE